ncbi:hypothetical protein PR048_025900 [Dryococelus australis]|uniref:Uncharacterized protein n=1 Tax=Dryococelus australis TaxID=614101 RepID=A0ABQ9GJU2_9NEOP|nr:hypothetical protein PR048_025900 [Dryococelus australis]
MRNGDVHIWLKWKIFSPQDTSQLLASFLFEDGECYVHLCSSPWTDEITESCNGIWHERNSTKTQGWVDADIRHILCLYTEANCFSPVRWGGGGTVTVRYSPLASHQGSNIRPGHSRFSHVGIVPDDAVGRWVFSGISRFPRSFIPVLLHTYLNHPHRLLRPRSTKNERAVPIQGSVKFCAKQSKRALRVARNSQDRNSRLGSPARKSLTLHCTMLAVADFISPATRRSAGSSSTSSDARHGPNSLSGSIWKITAEIQSAEGHERASCDRPIAVACGGLPLRIAARFSRYRSIHLGSLARDRSKGTTESSELEQSTHAKFGQGGEKVDFLRVTENLCTLLDILEIFQDRGNFEKKRDCENSLAKDFVHRQVDTVAATDGIGDPCVKARALNNEISLVQHFYIGTKIELDTGTELGPFDLGSRKTLVQPGISQRNKLLLRVSSARYYGRYVIFRMNCSIRSPDLRSTTLSSQVLYSVTFNNVTCVNYCKRQVLYAATLVIDVEKTFVEAESVRKASWANQDKNIIDEQKIVLYEVVLTIWPQTDFIERKLKEKSKETDGSKGLFSMMRVATPRYRHSCRNGVFAHGTYVRDHSGAYRICVRASSEVCRSNLDASRMDVGSGPWSSVLLSCVGESGNGARKHVDVTCRGRPHGLCDPQSLKPEVPHAQFSVPKRHVNGRNYLGKGEKVGKVRKISVNWEILTQNSTMVGEEFTKEVLVNRKQIYKKSEFENVATESRRRISNHLEAFGALSVATESRRRISNHLEAFGALSVATEPRRRISNDLEAFGALSVATESRRRISNHLED